jgi:hypothetical protein
VKKSSQLVAEYAEHALAAKPLCPDRLLFRHPASL